MTSLDYNQPVPLRDLAKCLRQRARPNKRLNVTILFRWAIKGVRGIRLQTVRTKDQTCSSVCWLVEFLRKTGEDRRHRMGPVVYEPHPRTFREHRIVRPDVGPSPETASMRKVAEQAVASASR
jgi:hypothetical protein